MSLLASDVLGVDGHAPVQANGNGHAPSHRYEITFSKDGKPVLPEPPAHDDVAGLCRWLTVVFNLNPAHPITGGKREGLRGPEGHVALERAGAPPIRFEPAARINSSIKLIETLSWRMIETDGAVHALAGSHCRQIAHVVRMLCGVAESMTDEQEAEAIVGTLMQASEAVTGIRPTAQAGSATRRPSHSDVQWTRSPVGRTARGGT